MGFEIPEFIKNDPYGIFILGLIGTLIVIGFLIIIVFPNKLIGHVYRKSRKNDLYAKLANQAQLQIQKEFTSKSPPLYKQNNKKKEIQKKFCPYCGRENIKSAKKCRICAYRFSFLK